MNASPRSNRAFTPFALAAFVALILGACARSGDEIGEQAQHVPVDLPQQAVAVEADTPSNGVLGSEVASVSTPFADTSWRLVEFQSMSDEVGTIRPAEGQVFTMELRADGTVAMSLDCNQANGTWSSEPTPGEPSGSFSFGTPMAMTRALCPPPNLDEKIARDAEWVRSYVLDDGRLHLSLMADGGIYVWEPGDAS